MRNELQPFIVTWVTYNSRVSERMVEYGFCKSPRVWLETESEIKVVSTIAQIVKTDRLRILAFNICGDHVHMVIVCSPKRLSSILQKLKSISSRQHNVGMGITEVGMKGGSSAATRGHDPLPDDCPSENHSPMPKKGKTQNHLWAQKFHRRQIRDPYYLYNAIRYVKYNRQKHCLPENTRLQEIIDGMICTEEEGFGNMESNRHEEEESQHPSSLNKGS